MAHPLNAPVVKSVYKVIS